MKSLTNFEKVAILVLSIGVFSTGNSGMITLYFFNGKYSKTPWKLLNPPINPCKIIIGLPSPFSM